jgi:hypothetical protein
MDTEWRKRVKAAAEALRPGADASETQRAAFRRAYEHAIECDGRWEARLLRVEHDGMCENYFRRIVERATA